MSDSTAPKLRRIIDEQNPWHRQGTVPSSYNLPVQRPLALLLWERLLDDSPRRYQLILGPRRVGKTTVLYQTVSNLLENGIDSSRIWWLRLDHPVLQREELGDLVDLVVRSCGASADRPAFVMLDELVYAESWDTWLKAFFDDQWPVRIAATSSASAALRRGRVESGIGRWEEQHLTPYSLIEYVDLAAVKLNVVASTDLPDWKSRAERTLADTIRAIPPGPPRIHGLDQLRRRLFLAGGFPELIELYLSEPNHDGHTEERFLLHSQDVLRNDAVERTLYKDIPQSFGVNNPMLLERLLYVLADQVCGLLSPTNIGRDLGITTPTFDRYLSYLEEAFLIFMLHNYSTSESKVQRRGRKVYFIDSAVRNAALQRGRAMLDEPDEMGRLLENLVAASLRSLAVQAGVRLYHWRDGNREVDLLYDDPTSPLAFEIASSASHSRAGLEALCDRYRKFRGNSYLVAPNLPVNHPRSSDVGTLPLDDLLLAIGAQAHRALTQRMSVVHKQGFDKEREVDVPEGSEHGA